MCMTTSPCSTIVSIAMIGVSLGAAVAGAQAPCPPLPPPTPPIVDVYPAQADSLRGIIAAAATGTTIR